MEYKVTQVGDVHMKLVNYNRSLELCALMNYEMENIDFIDELDANDVYYDIGACEGRFSIYAGLQGIRTFAFEPEKRNYDAFTQNLSLNFPDANLSPITPFNIALGSSQLNVKMNIGQPWAGGHQKVIAGHERGDLVFEKREVQEVVMFPLDFFIEQRQLPIPSFIKVDIDGSEMDFVEGARQTLAHRTLKKLMIELYKKDESYGKILDELLLLGLKPKHYFAIPNEDDLYNVLFVRNP